MQKNNFFKTLRDDRGARAIAITVTVMLLVLTAIIVTTVIANRKMGETPDPYAGQSEPALSNNPDDPDPGEEDVPEDNKPAQTEPTQFLLPVNGVLQKSYSTDIQVFSETMRDYRVHTGIDIGTVDGASVSAMADGVISQIFDDVRMGHCIAVKHGEKTYTIYKNLKPEDPEGIMAGATVKAGDIIGTVGESAMVETAQSPHLHLEMTVGDLSVNPLDYLDEAARATLNESTDYEDVS